MESSTRLGGGDGQRTVALAQLPAFDEIADPSFGSDVPEMARRLLAGPARLMRLEGSRGDGDNAVAFRHADLAELASTPEVANIPPAAISEQPVLYEMLANHIFTMQPPTHAPMRRLFSRHFTPNRIADYRSTATAVVDELIAEAAERDAVDLFEDLAVPTAARFWGRQMGLTTAEIDEIAAIFAGDFSMNFDFVRTPDEDERVIAAAGRYMTVMRGAVERDLARGENELIGAMSADLLASDVEGRPETVGLLLASALTDGIHTLAGALANAAHALLRRPQELARVRADPALAAGAFAEGVRLDPPLIITFRSTIADVECAGARLPAGTAIQMLWMVGNRDPERFPDPDTYDLQRTTPSHSFGGGQHLCPGRSVSGLLGQILLGALAARDIEAELLDHEPRWLTGTLMHALAHYPVRIRRT